MTTRAIIWLAVSTTAQAAEDKASLAQQEADARAACEQHGWRIVDILRVTGHSRNYIDIHECAAAMRAEGIDAFDKLLAHWRATDFDVLVVRDGSRFARTQSLHAYVVERTIQTGAQIYSLTDGVIDTNNYRMFVSMAGFATAGEVDNIRRRHRMGTDALIARGLPPNGRVSSAHRIIRDANSGKVIGVELKPERRQEWLHLAELLLEGVPYLQLAQEMFNRFGYASPLGKPYHSIYYHRLLHTPSFWGHGGRRDRQYGRWAWDESEPTPTGVDLKRNSYEPVYDGELAERVKAELRRRTEIRGKSSPYKGRRFVNLFRCGECGNTLIYTTNKHRQKVYVTLYCYTAYSKHAFGACNNRKRILEAAAAKVVRETLASFQQHGWLALEADIDGTTQKASELNSVADDIQRTEKQLRSLITKQTSVDDSASYIYDEMIQTQAERLRILQTRQRELQSQLENTSISAVQRRAAEELQALDIDTVMRWDDRPLNQLLHRLMGRYRWYMHGAQVVGIGIPPPKRRRRY